MAILRTRMRCMDTMTRTLRYSLAWKFGLVLLTLYLAFQLYSTTVYPSPTLILGKTVTQLTVTRMTEKPIRENGMTEKPIRESGAVLCLTFNCGRLGNMLFEYASINAIALATGRTPVLNNSEALQAVLKYPPSVPDPGDDKAQAVMSRCANATTVRGDGGSFARRLMKLQPERSFRVKDCLQSWKYFAGRFDEVRHWVTFNDAIVDEASRMIEDLRNRHPNSYIVGVHVRRGDILQKKYALRGWNPPEAGYFLRAMVFLRNMLNSRLTFAVVSQDPDWCYKHLAKHHSDVVVMNGRSPEVDMQFLSMTDHFIMSLGSFGWWAAFKMTNHRSKVVYFRDWTKQDSNLSRYFTVEDYVLPNWIPVV